MTIFTKCLFIFFSGGLNPVLLNKEFELEILNVDNTWFTWRIMCFPVTSFEFVNVSFKSSGKIFNGLVNKKQWALIGSFKCTSHCTINITGKQYIVLWEMTNEVASATDNENQEIESSSDEEDEDIDEVLHSLPFKVLGSCHSKDRQNALEEAFECVYEHNRPAFFKLQAEPENKYDNNAIAVLIKSSSDYYEKVGYIARELTIYVHPYLSEVSFCASIKCIRFRTTFLMVGFYITITLTKKGLWHNQVVKASKSVK
jgi:hypothetical protein